MPRILTIKPSKPQIPLNGATTHDGPTGLGKYVTLTYYVYIMLYYDAITGYFITRIFFSSIKHALIGFLGSK